MREPMIDARFESQVELGPDRACLVYGEVVLSYREVNERANQLAHYLRGLGVGPEVMVGICVERSPELLIGLLGILKAGGAYLPLEPSYPAERLAYMLGDAGPALVLTQSRCRDALQASSARLIDLDIEWPTIAAAGKANPVAPGEDRDGQRLAYTIYTSGSTGRPKGVMVSHRALANTLQSMSLEPGLHAHDTLLAVTGISFDIAALELFLPLTVGARVVIASREQAADALLLANLLASCGATVMQATPATWRMLLDGGWRGDPRLKVLCGGEALPLELARRLEGHCASLWNLYGPTETTIWSAVAPIDPAAGRVPIGPPIANTQFYILDAHLQPVPIGVHGELYIGGTSVSRGYLRRPDLTAERFIPDPFGSQPGARLYRSGDRVRWRPDRSIEFHGRLDDQVKIRGFRIELGEVEAVTAAHPAVREAVAVARPDPAGGHQLVAYVVPAEPAPSIGDLRAHLKTRLPDYMIPSAFVLIKTLPLTANGKVDRKALPAPEQDRTSLATTYLAPRDRDEELLAGIWAEVLGIPRVGINDNFFELGGHSLLATQAIARIRKTFNAELSLIALFQTPTIAELVKLVNAAARTRKTSAPPAKIDRAAPTPLRARVQDLSDSDVSTMLKEMLAQEEARGE
jgi:amino acid adenylation domain-containing protein